MATRKVQDPIIIGKRFDRLTVVSEADPVIRSNGKSMRRWNCLCDCGLDTTATQSDLRTGNTKSCGCLYKESRHTVRLKHGQSKSGGAYNSWLSMKRRCYCQVDKKYPDYGSRGITVCDAWREDFEAFVNDMGPRPPGYSLDRINNNGNYEPGNCRWATPAEQAANTRTNIWVRWLGEQMILGEAIRRAGLPRKAVEHRLTRGWSLDRALETPLRVR